MTTALIIIGIVVALTAVAAIAVLVLRYLAIHGRLMRKYNDEAVVRRIMDKDIWQGMSEEQLIDSIGRPADVDERVMKTKVARTLKYGPIGKNRFSTRIKVEDGIVVGWDHK